MKNLKDVALFLPVLAFGVIAAWNAIDIIVSALSNILWIVVAGMGILIYALLLKRLGVNAAWLRFRLPPA